MESPPPAERRRSARSGGHITDWALMTFIVLCSTLGVGILSLPWAFHRLGVLAACATAYLAASLAVRGRKGGSPPC